MAWKWEYKVETIGHLPEQEVEEKLNQLGKSGWELIAFYMFNRTLEGKMTVTAFLKREKK